MFLKASSIVKSYRSDDKALPVLRGIDLTVNEGELLAIIGASGVGKSTLMHILGTLDMPDEGKLMMDGVDVFQLSEKERTQLRRESIGFVFQFHHLLPEFTALENVAMPLMIARASTNEALTRAQELLEILGLANRAEHRCAQLSGGEQQRVAVARALTNKPRLVLADEPTGNLDTKHSFELLDLIRKLHDEQGLTSVIVTHSESLAAVCDRTLLMKDGYLS